jgi:hypothetical protein
METSSVIVVASASQAEQLLLAGDIGCPGCNATLRPHGHGRTRTVRGVGAQRVTHTPRRARCGDCGRTQILLPTELTVRRADTTEAIGNALVAKANGAGHRTIAAGLVVRHRQCAAGSAAPAAHTPSGCTSKACRRSWPSIGTC